MRSALGGGWDGFEFVMSSSSYILSDPCLGDRCEGL
jgi:hypothetical protein